VTDVAPEQQLSKIYAPRVASKTQPKARLAQDIAVSKILMRIERRRWIDVDIIGEQL
jgi:hypothetical protein